MVIYHFFGKLVLISTQPAYNYYWRTFIVVQVIMIVILFFGKEFMFICIIGLSEPGTMDQISQVNNVLVADLCLDWQIAD